MQQKQFSVVHGRTGTDNALFAQASWKEMDAPAAIRTNRRRDATVEAMKQSGVDMLDIPAFLRKQAD
jgi:cell division protein FtsZ